MADQVHVRTDMELKDALDRVKREGDATTDAGAMRTLAREGARERGYLNGHTPMTGLRSGVRTVGAWFLLFAAGWIGLTYFYPVSWRLPAVGMLVSAFVCYGVDKMVLARYEPRVSDRISGLLGGAKA